MNGHQRIAAVLLAAGVGLLAAAWLFLATAPIVEPVAQVRQPQPVKNAARGKAKRRWRGGGREAAASEAAEAMELPADGVAPTTDACAWVVNERRRGVHAFVLMDNIRDQGLRFQEDDVACLTAAGVDESIVRYAEFDMTSRMLKEGDVVGIQ